MDVKSQQLSWILAAVLLGAALILLSLVLPELAAACWVGGTVLFAVALALAFVRNHADRRRR